jgi:hypothetical protein
MCFFSGIQLGRHSGRAGSRGVSEAAEPSWRLLTDERASAIFGGKAWIQVVVGKESEWA